MFRGLRVLLGVTGGIAAYKAAVLARLLVRGGAEVRVVMTPLAKEFITPLTMATVSKNSIVVDFFDPEDGRWNSHVGLGEWADVMLVAPATANTLAKMAAGVADNLLLTTYLSARCPVFVAPAMDLDMYRHPATRANLDILRSRGVEIFEPGEGELASGLSGKGRMAEPEEIVVLLEEYFSAKSTLKGKKFLVTAGPTREAIDPVRYISNHSTGKMGYAIAGELARRGAEVVLVSGPVEASLCVPRGVTKVDVVTAEEMAHAAIDKFEGADAAVLCAAVADYTPANPAERKIKKSVAEEGTLSLELRETIDIAAALGRVKGNRLLVGFALETDNEIRNARQKLTRKNLDLIVLNSLRDPGAGPSHDTNKITILTPDGQTIEHPLAPKTEIARIIINTIEQHL